MFFNFTKSVILENLSILDFALSGVKGLKVSFSERDVLKVPLLGDITKQLCFALYNPFTSYISWVIANRKLSDVDVVFFYCAISLDVGVVFFYCAISMASLQLEITSNTEVTQNGHFPVQNFTLPSLKLLNASKSLPATILFLGANRLWLSLRMKSLICTPTLLA